MDLDKAPLWSGKRAKWTSEEERDRRRANRLCFRCGGKGHMIGDCPLLPAVPPSGSTRIAVGQHAPITVPDGAWDEEKEQGKE